MTNIKKGLTGVAILLCFAIMTLFTLIGSALADTTGWNKIPQTVLPQNLALDSGNFALDISNQGGYPFYNLSGEGNDDVVFSESGVTLKNMRYESNTTWNPIWLWGKKPVSGSAEYEIVFNGSFGNGNAKSNESLIVILNSDILTQSQFEGIRQRPWEWAGTTDFQKFERGIILELGLSDMASDVKVSTCTLRSYNTVATDLVRSDADGGSVMTAGLADSPNFFTGEDHVLKIVTTATDSGVQLKVTVDDVHLICNQTIAGAAFAGLGNFVIGAQGDGSGTDYAADSADYLKFKKVEVESGAEPTVEENGFELEIPDEYNMLQNQELWTLGSGSYFNNNGELVLTNNEKQIDFGTYAEFNTPIESGKVYSVIFQSESEWPDETVINAHLEIFVNNKSTKAGLDRMIPSKWHIGDDSFDLSMANNYTFLTHYLQETGLWHPATSTISPLPYIGGVNLWDNKEHRLDFATFEGVGEQPPRLVIYLDGFQFATATAPRGSAFDGTGTLGFYVRNNSAENPRTVMTTLKSVAVSNITGDNYVYVEPETPPVAVVIEPENDYNQLVNEKLWKGTAPSSGALTLSGGTGTLLNRDLSSDASLSTVFKFSGTADNASLARIHFKNKTGKTDLSAFTAQDQALYLEISKNAVSLWEKVGTGAAVKLIDKTCGLLDGNKHNVTVRGFETAKGTVIDIYVDNLHFGTADYSSGISSVFSKVGGYAAYSFAGGGKLDVACVAVKTQQGLYEYVFASEDWEKPSVESQYNLTSLNNWVYPALYTEFDDDKIVIKDYSTGSQDTPKNVAAVIKDNVASEFDLVMDFKFEAEFVAGETSFFAVTFKNYNGHTTFQSGVPWYVAGIPYVLSFGQWIDTSQPCIELARMEAYGAGTLLNGVIDRVPYPALSEGKNMVLELSVRDYIDPDTVGKTGVRITVYIDGVKLIDAIDWDTVYTDAVGVEHDWEVFGLKGKIGLWAFCVDDNIPTAAANKITVDTLSVTGYDSGTADNWKKIDRITALKALTFVPDGPYDINETVRIGLTLLYENPAYLDVVHEVSMGEIFNGVWSYKPDRTGNFTVQLSVWTTDYSDSCEVTFEFTVEGEAETDPEPSDEGCSSAAFGGGTALLLLITAALLVVVTCIRRKKERNTNEK